MDDHQGTMAGGGTTARGSARPAGYPAGAPRPTQSTTYVFDSRHIALIEAYARAHGMEPKEVIYAMCEEFFQHHGSIKGRSQPPEVLRDEDVIDDRGNHMRGISHEHPTHEPTSAYRTRHQLRWASLALSLPPRYLP